MATLIEAAQVGDINIIDIHSQHGSDLNVADANGKTALMYAAENDHLAFTTKLVTYGADFKLADKSGNSALSLACWKGHKFIVQFLLDIGAHIDARSIAEALSAEVLEMLLNKPEIINLNHFRFNTRPLIFAFTDIKTEECYKKLHLIMRHGANPNITDLYLETPLMALVRSVKKNDDLEKLYWVAESIKLMLYVGADYTRANGFLETFDTLLVENRNRIRMVQTFFTHFSASS